MNLFHCVDVKEHVENFSIDDVKNYVDYIKLFGKHQDEKIMSYAQRLINEEADAGPVHGFLHVALEDDINKLESGNVDKCIMLGALIDLHNDANKVYPMYLRAVEITNECGRDKREPISEDKFKKLLGAS